MIVIYKPLKVGDQVLISDEFGTVEDITLWHSVIRTWDLRRVIMPNSNLAQASFINYSAVDPKKLMWFIIGISYDSDIDSAKKIMMEEATKHPNVLAEPPPMVSVIEFGDFSVNLRLLFWAKDQSTGFSTKLDLQESTKKAFDDKGIEIPCPVRELSLTPKFEKTMNDYIEQLSINKK
jgi:small-conductance mechanosensitive channel